MSVLYYLIVSLCKGFYLMKGCYCFCYILSRLYLSSLSDLGWWWVFSSCLVSHNCWDVVLSVFSLLRNFCVSMCVVFLQILRLLTKCNWKFEGNSCYSIYCYYLQSCICWYYIYILASSYNMTKIGLYGFFVVGQVRFMWFFFLK